MCCYLQCMDFCWKAHLKWPQWVELLNKGAFRIRFVALTSNSIIYLSLLLFPPEKDTTFWKVLEKNIPFKIYFLLLKANKDELTVYYQCDYSNTFLSIDHGMDLTQWVGILLCRNYTANHFQAAQSSPIFLTISRCVLSFRFLSTQTVFMASGSSRKSAPYFHVDTCCKIQRLNCS